MKELKVQKAASISNFGGSGTWIKNEVSNLFNVKKNEKMKLKKIQTTPKCGGGGTW